MNDRTKSQPATPRDLPGPALDPSGRLVYAGTSTELKRRIDAGELPLLAASCLCLDGYLPFTNFV